MRKKSWYDLMDAYREATLEFAASWAEGYAAFGNRCGCGRKGCSSCARPSRGHARGGGDFLADLVRVNVDYVGQLARLNSAYTVLAARFLDRLYSKTVYDHYRDAEAVAHLCGKVGDPVYGRLVVSNELTREAEISIKGIASGTLERHLTSDDDGDDKAGSLSLSIEREDRAPRTSPLKPEQEVVFALSAKVPPLDPGRYHTHIKIKVDGEPRRFGVVLEVLG